MKIRTLLIILIILGLNSILGAFEWQHLGLTGKTVLSLAVDPDDSDNIIAGTTTGLFVTLNGGDAWNAGISFEMDFPDVAYAPLADDTVFCLASGGSYSDGLYYSTNDGQNWYLVGYYINGRRMGFDEFNPGFMYICFEDGILKSQNYFDTYSTANNGLPDTDIYDVIGDGTYGMEAYALGSDFLANTTDFANTWSEIDSTFSLPEDPRRIICDPNNTWTLYVVCDQEIVILEVPHGDWDISWDYTELPSSGFAPIVCNPGNTGEIYIASTTGGGVYKSLNSGESFFVINGDLANRYVHSLAISPDGYLLAGTQNGIYAVDMSTVGIDEPEPDGLPQSYSLSQNYPNPFNANTIINVNLADNQRGKVEIYDIAGRLVKTLFDGYGSQTLVWDGSNTQGQPVSSGIYLYRLQTADKVEYSRMTLLR